MPDACDRDATPKQPVANDWTWPNLDMAVASDSEISVVCDHPRRSRDGASLGAEDLADPGQGVSWPQASRRTQLAHGRNLHQGERPVEVPL